MEKTSLNKRVKKYYYIIQDDINIDGLLHLKKTIDKDFFDFIIKVLAELILKKEYEKIKELRKKIGKIPVDIIDKAMNEYKKIVKDLTLSGSRFSKDFETLGYKELLNKREEEIKKRYFKFLEQKEDKKTIAPVSAPKKKKDKYEQYLKKQLSGTSEKLELKYEKIELMIKLLKKSKSKISQSLIKDLTKKSEEIEQKYDKIEYIIDVLNK